MASNKGNFISNNHNLVYLSSRQQANGNNNNNNNIQLTDLAQSQKQKFKLIPPANANSPDHQSPLSSSSLQSITTTDSETSIELSAGNGNSQTTLQDDKQRGILINNNNGNSRQLQANKQTNGGQSKSPPILIKYNYYDYNGDRQEQTNQDMNFNSGNNKISRQLSPTFKQNLDQIVRNSQQYLMSANNSYHSPSDSPQRQMSPTNNNNNNHNQFNTMMLARRYKLSSYEQRCLRCRKTVYQMDKVGPLKDFTFYHQNCFKCLECGTKLTLKTYFNNQHSSVDQEVYCHRHCPKTPAGKLDNQSVGIRAALNAPKVFDVHQVLGQSVGGNFIAQDHPDHHLINHQPEVLNMGSVHEMIANKNNNNNLMSASNNGGQFIFSPNNGSKHVASVDPPNVDSSALYIQHAVQQTKLQAIYKQSQVDKKISQFLNKRLEYLEPRQKLLEMRHREEEEQLFKQFEAKWRQEETCISEQIRQEWQLELNKLIEKYKQQLSNIHRNSSLATSNNQANEEQQRQHLELMGDLRRRVEECEDKLTSTGRQANGRDQEQQMIELERMNLEKTMTIKLDKKKLTLKRKLKEFERQATAELVERQSREMLTLISMKLEEFKEEQKRKIGSELEQFEAIESLANQLGASLQVSDDSTKAQARQQADRQQHQRAANKAPPPRAPKTSKMDLYNSEQPDEVFKEIDELAINVAREDQQTFTDLVHHLTRNCLTDVAKVRAIFRWITVKNLNTMQFDDPSIKPDTPLGLLRGIKQGSESYHVLFKRLCSYAGLHCVVIKGYSKSAGYQPGVSFEGARFRNSWNAVYVAGAWRFVQCNWGARHLVSVAVMQDNNNNNNGNGKTNNLADGPHAGRKAAVVGRSQQVRHEQQRRASPLPNLGRRGATDQQQQRSAKLQNGSGARNQPDDIKKLSPSSPAYSSTSSSSSSNLSSCSASSSSSSPPLSSCCPSPSHLKQAANKKTSQQADSLRYEYDDHYFLTDPDEFIYEFFPLAAEWQLLRSRPLTLQEFEQLPFVRSLFFKYGLYFAQADIRSVLLADSSGATTIKIGMPTHMVPSLIFHCNLKYFHSDAEDHNGISLKRFVMQSVESGTTSNDAHGQVLMSNIVSFRVHLPENGAYILDIFANSTTPSQYITGEPMKFKSVCKFKIIANNLKTVMIPLPDCASGEYGLMKATRLFGLIPITHENGLINCQNDRRFLEIQFRMTRPLLDFMASLHKNGHDERLLSKCIKIFVDGDIVFITIKFIEDGQYGLDIYTRDQQVAAAQNQAEQQMVDTQANNQRRGQPTEAKKQLLTHCCKYLINVRGVK